MRVSEECVACGKCEDACIFGQVTVTEGRALVGEGCKGCGRCVVACPEGALAFEFDPAFIERAVSFIGSQVDVT